jgi:amino acid transporter
MYLALCGCLFVLLVADGAALWHGFLIPGFLSAYLAVCSSPHLKSFGNSNCTQKPLCFVVLWFGIKFLRWRSLKLRLENLSDFEEAKLRFRYLDEIAQRAAVRVQPQQPRGWGNLWGLM